MSTHFNIKKSKIGRPSIDSEPVTVRLERSALMVLDDWRRAQTDLPTRPEAIRRLIELGIAADLGDLIDGVRRLMPQLPNRAEAARLLIELGLRPAYEHLLEAAYRAYEDGRRSDDPPEKILIYQARIQDCRDALARIEKLPQSFAGR